MKLFPLALTTAMFPKVLSPDKSKDLLLLAKTSLWVILAFLSLQVQAQSSDFVPGTLVIKVKGQHRNACTQTEINLPTLQNALQSAGVFQIQKTFPQASPPTEAYNHLGQKTVDLSLIYNLSFDPAKNIQEVLDALQGLNCLVYAEPRYSYTLLYEPNDPSRQLQWYLDTLGAYHAWDISRGDSSVIIGIVDTGTSFAHSDLDSSVAFNPLDPIDGIDNDQDGYIDNYRGWDFGGSYFGSGGDNNPNFVGSGPGKDHGVLTSAIAAAESDNATGMASIGFNCSYLPLKASVDNSLSISYGYEALVYAADHGVPIINLSWGSTYNSQLGKDAVNYAVVNKGALLVAAAGNRHQESLYYPASYERVISVAGTQRGDQIWVSNAQTGSSYNYLVDISAPGSYIYTAAGNTGYWGGATGTSMAAPMVSGAAGLLKSWDPSLNNRQLGELLRVSAKDISGKNPGFDEKMGRGRLHLPGAFDLNLKSLRIDTLGVEDYENGFFEATDTLYLFPHLINYLAPLQNPQIQISSPYPDYVEVIDSLWKPGPMGSMDHLSPQQGLRIRVKPGITQFKTIYLRFGIEDGTYSDYQYMALPVQPAWLDINHNALRSTLPGDGRLGYVDKETNSYGWGFRNYNRLSLVSSLSFLTGSSGFDLLNGFSKADGSRDLDFVMKGKPRANPTALANGWEAQAQFEAPNNIRAFEQKVWAFASPTDSNYVLVQYEIQNQGSDTLFRQFAGLGAEWSPFGSTFQGSTYDAQKQCFYNRFYNGITAEYCAIVLLSELPDNYFAEDTADFDFSRVSKFAAISSGIQQRHTGSEAPLQFLSAGPFDLLPGQKQTIAFALVIEEDLPSLIQSVDQARQTYFCTILQKYPVSDLPAEARLCPGVDSLQLSSQLSPSKYSFLWDDGSNSPSRTIGQAGTYQLRISNSLGCQIRDTVEVRPSGLQGSIQAQNSPQSLTLTFQTQANGDGPLHYFWDLGDDSFSNLPLFSHGYARPDSYQVILRIEDDFCEIEDSLWVHPLLLTHNLNPAESSQLQLWPQPAKQDLYLSWEHSYRGPLTLEIYSLDGSRISVQSLDKGQPRFLSKLPIQSLSPGTYLLKVNFAGEHVFKRILIH